MMKVMLSLLAVVTLAVGAVKADSPAHVRVESIGFMLPSGMVYATYDSDFDVWFAPTSCVGQYPRITTSNTPAVNADVFSQRKNCALNAWLMDGTTNVKIEPYYTEVSGTNWDFYGRWNEEGNYDTMNGCFQQYGQAEIAQKRTADPHAVWQQTAITSFLIRFIDE